MVESPAASVQDDDTAGEGADRANNAFEVLLPRVVGLRFFCSWTHSVLPDSAYIDFPGGDVRAKLG